MNLRLPEAVTSGFTLWGVILEGHYHQDPFGAMLFVGVGTLWLMFLTLTKSLK